MATQATAQILAKGPLSSALGQWVFLGFGTFVIFTGDNGVSIAAKEIASVAFRLVTGRDATMASGAALFREAALGNRSANDAVGRYESAQQQQQYQQQQQPIVIHTSTGARGWTATLIQLGLGAGACWTAYLVFSNFLPEQIKEMLPVTRKFFESAVTSLGEGILHVRDVLSKKIDDLGTKQDELGCKQDRTHDQVLGLKDDVGDVRLHIDDIAVAISRCESSLGDAAGRQTYMSRGVQLLVQCVGDLLRPSNPAVAAELDQFSRMTAGLMDHDAPTSRTNATGTASPSPTKKHRQHLDYPSSPNLSEIGSTTSTIVDDHHHGNMRPLSLSHSRSQPTATPRSSNNMMSPSPSSLLGMSPSPGGLKMLQTVTALTSSSSNVTATTASSSMASSYSSPENELPQANYQDKPLSGHSTPSDRIDGTDLADLDELLRTVRRGSS